MSAPTTTGGSRPPTSSTPPAGSELRSMLTRERRCSPALLVVAGCAAIVAAAAGPKAWIWLAAFGANVIGRAALATQFEAADPPLPPSSAPAIAYFTSHAIDIVLWAVLFGLIGSAMQLFASGAGFAAGGA